MDYAALKNDILTGPHAAELAQFVNVSHTQIASILNSKPSGKYERANIDELSRYLLDQGLWPDIEDNVGNGNAGVKKAARQFMHAQKLAGAVQTLDVHAVGAQAAFTALESAGIISAEQRAAIEAMGRQLSYAESTYGQRLTHSDVTEALKS